MLYSHTKMWERGPRTYTNPRNPHIGIDLISLISYYYITNHHMRILEIKICFMTWTAHIDNQSSPSIPICNNCLPLLTQYAENYQKEKLDRSQKFDEINYVELSVMARTKMSFYFRSSRQGVPWGTICKYNGVHNSVHKEELWWLGKSEKGLKDIFYIRNKSSNIKYDDRWETSMMLKNWYCNSISWKYGLTM